MSSFERYHFNLTNGSDVLRDEEGIELSDLRTATVHAIEMLEHLGRENLSSASWQGWKLEIVDSSGRMVHSISLEVFSMPRVTVN